MRKSVPPWLDVFPNQLVRPARPIPFAGIRQRYSGRGNGPSVDSGRARAATSRKECRTMTTRVELLTSPNSTAADEVGDLKATHPDLPVGSAGGENLGPNLDASVLSTRPCNRETSKVGA